MSLNNEATSVEAIRAAITKAITKSNYKWRTPRGISREIDFSEDKVFDLLNNSGNYIRSRVPDRAGQPLFTTREKYRAGTRIIDRIVSAIINKPE